MQGLKTKAPRRLRCAQILRGAHFERVERDSLQSSAIANSPPWSRNNQSAVQIYSSRARAKPIRALPSSSWHVSLCGEAGGVVGQWEHEDQLEVRDGNSDLPGDPGSKSRIYIPGPPEQYFTLLLFAITV